MGGVNFTRNRAWWHTAIWDEYGQRHQYLALIPSMIFLIPLYWYGAGINRTLEQNYAARNYALEYENRRLRLTHNMIMEHFEMHVEKAQKIMDEVQNEGFEKAFEYEIKHPFTEFIKDKTLLINEELLAEMDEYSGKTQAIDEIIEHSSMPYWERQKLEKFITRRKQPYSPFKHIQDVNTTQYSDPIEHTYLNPYENASVIPKLTEDTTYYAEVPKRD